MVNSPRLRRNSSKSLLEFSSNTSSKSEKNKHATISNAIKDQEAAAAQQKKFSLETIKDRPSDEDKQPP